MLRIMREQASNWIIKVLLFAIVVVFVFWGVGNFKSKKAARVASVNGDWITIDEFQSAYNNMIERYRQTFGNNLSSEMINALNLRSQALDQLINNRLMLQAASELKFRVTDEELSASIREMPYFQRDGQFNDALYTSILRRMNTDPEKFQEDQRNGLLLTKLKGFITKSAKVSDEESMEWYNWDKAQVNIEYAVFPIKKYADIKPSEEDLKTFFEANKENFKTDPQVKTRFLMFDPKKFSAKVTVPDTDVKTYYETNMSLYQKEKTVEARHILIKVGADEDEAAVEEKRKKIVEILAKAKKGEDFAELAKKFSEGPSKDKGGDLGAFKKGDMVKPFSDKAFSMKSGEISDPVKTQFGWHIIKVDKVNEASTTPFEKAEAEIRKKLLDRHSKDKAFDLANEIYENSFEGDDLVEAAKNFELTLENTDFFTRTGPVLPSVSNPAKFATIAFNMNEMDISEVQEINGIYYIIQTTEKKAPFVPELSVVKDKVTDELKKDKQWESAKTDADKCLESLKSEKDFGKATAAFKIKPEETGFFSRNVSMPKIGYEPKVSEAAFGLSKEKKIADNSLKGTNAYYVLQLKERKLPEQEGFEKEKKNIEEKLLRQKQDKLFEQWLQSLKDKGTITKEEIFFQQ